MGRTKYASSLKKEDYTFHPGRDFQLDWDKLNQIFDDETGKNPCYLVALTDKQISVLQAHLSVFPQYHWVWGLKSPRATWDSSTWAKWDEITAFIGELEDCLMAGCEVSELIKAIRQTNAILAGEEVDLTVPIPDELDYTTTEEGVIKAIVPALLAIEAAEKGEVATLEDILTEMDNSLLENLGDLSEVLIFLKELLPNWSLEIPITDLLEAFALWRYRQSHINLLYDIAMSERAQAVAQGGIDGAAIYDTIGDGMEDLLTVGSSGLFGPLAGAATWLWLQVRPTQVSGWTDFLSSISGWLLGSIRGATYDVAEAIGNLKDKIADSGTLGDSIDGVATAIDNIEPDNFECAPDVNVTCGTGAGEDITDDPPADDPGDPATDPPPTGFDTWPEYDSYKCLAANYLFESTLALFRSIGAIDATVLGAASGAALATWLLSVLESYMLASAASITFGTAALTVLGGSVLAYASGWIIAAIVAAAVAVAVVAGFGVFQVFDAAADEFELMRNDTVCALYNAGSVDEARTTLSTAWGDAIAWFVIDPPYNAYEAQIRTMLSTIIGYLLTNKFLNQLFQESDTVNKFTDAAVDCTTCGSGCESISVHTVDYGGWRTETTAEGTFLVVEASEFISGTWGNYHSAKIRFTPNLWLKFRDDLSTIVGTGDSDYPYEVSLYDCDTGTWYHHDLSSITDGHWLERCCRVLVRTTPSDSTLEAWFECSDVDPT